MSYSLLDCRVCLENVGIWPIFGDDLKPDISMEIAEIGTIRLRPDDDLPKHICESCFLQLQGAVSFRRTAKHTDLMLRKGKQTKMSALQCTDIQNEAVKPEAQSSDFNEYENLEIDFVLVEEHTEEGLPPVKFEPFHHESNVGSCFVSDDYNDEKDYDKDENQSEQVMLVLSHEEKKLKKEKFSCTYCNIEFNDEIEFEQHRNSIEHKRNYVISFLPKKKRKSTAITKKKIVNRKDSKCDICDKFFTKLRFLKHMQTEHNIILSTTSKSTNKQECTVCKKMFHPVSLPRHMKNIHGDARDLAPKVKLECPICKKSFSKHFYPLHIQRHKEGETKNYICDQCGKKFFFKSSLSTHRLIHTNDLPHKCEYCPYRGRTKDLLKIHIRTHTGDYRYKCTQCDTRCLTKSNLNSHMRRHRGPIDFICDTCNRGFYSKVQLERHITVTHYGVKSYVCSTCGVAFGYKHGLTSHQRKVHKRPKGLGKPKAVYLQLEEKGLLQPQEEV